MWNKFLNKIKLWYVEGLTGELSIDRKYFKKKIKNDLKRLKKSIKLSHGNKNV